MYCCQNCKLPCDFPAGKAAPEISRNWSAQTSVKRHPPDDLLVFRKFFNGKGLYLWNSVAEDLRDGLQVSFLVELGDEVVMGWRWLGHIWDRDDPAARFPS